MRPPLGESAIASPMERYGPDGDTMSPFAAVEGFRTGGVALGVFGLGDADFVVLLRFCGRSLSPTWACAVDEFVMAIAPASKAVWANSPMAIADHERCLAPICIVVLPRSLLASLIGCFTLVAPGWRCVKQNFGTGELPGRNYQSLREILSTDPSDR
jgi:hypothetical protein